MTGAQVEYVGFTTNERTRVYTLRVRQKAAEAIEVTLSIDSQAFLDKRVRYQDGPEICFLKLQKELTARPDDRAEERLLPLEHVVEVAGGVARPSRDLRHRRTGEAPLGKHLFGDLDQGEPPRLPDAVTRETSRGFGHRRPSEPK